jgi:hypothetical protein
MDAGYNRRRMLESLRTGGVLYRCCKYEVIVCYFIWRTGLTYTALSGSVDLFLAIYPATVLWKLQMNRKKKIGLSVTLGLGVM